MYNTLSTLAAALALSSFAAADIDSPCVYENVECAPVHAVSVMDLQPTLTSPSVHRKIDRVQDPPLTRSVRLQSEDRTRAVAKAQALEVFSPKSSLSCL